MTYDRVKAIIVSHLGVDPDTVEPETKFTALGADSLDMLELSMSFEDEFNTRISDDDLDGIVTVQDAVNKVQELVR